VGDVSAWYTSMLDGIRRTKTVDQQEQQAHSNINISVILTYWSSA